LALWSNLYQLEKLWQPRMERQVHFNHGELLQATKTWSCHRFDFRQSPKGWRFCVVWSQSQWSVN
jgi:hypothetical protein